MTTTWDSPIPIDTQAGITQGQLFPVAPAPPYDVSGFDYALLELSSAGQGTTSGTQWDLIWSDEVPTTIAGLGAGVGPLQTFNVRGVTQPGNVLYAVRCLGPKLQVQLSSTSGPAPEGGFTLWGSNRRYRFDGPYTPSAEGIILAAGSALLPATTGNETVALPPYSGPVNVFFLNQSNNPINEINGTNYAGTTNFLRFDSATTPQVFPFWLPPMANSLNLNNLGTVSASVYWGVIAA